MKKVVVVICIFLSIASYSQNIDRPKLVIGIVVDQMRPDYLYRFYNRYEKDGFKRLLGDGFVCANTFIPYTPTVTGAGHTCIYTGSVPALHGIMGNTWYDRSLKKNVYCTDDKSVQTVGSLSAAGHMSPKNLWSSTITDELRLASNFKNKTIAIAIKDRGSIFPAGATANGAYWFETSSGNWISSSFYMQELPEWMKKFNEKKLPDVYMNQNWNTLYPLNTYTQSTADSNRYENKMYGEDATFPHMTHSITGNKYEAFVAMPQGNTYTFETAKAAIEGEQLGSRGITDFLALSFSSTDIAGHAFGPNSVEIEDMYLRFDKELGKFLKYLDVKIGKGQYLLFLTADHAVGQNPLFLKDNKLPGGTAKATDERKVLNERLQKEFNVTNLIESAINSQFYLNDSIISKNKLDKKSIKDFITTFYLKQPGVANVVDLGAIQSQDIPPKVKMRIVNGYNQKLSGDLQIIYKPQWFENYTTGASHGTWYPYDSHIPLIWYGWKIKKGESAREVYMTDIAPTLAALLHIQMPNACIGNAIEEVVK